MVLSAVKGRYEVGVQESMDIFQSKVVPGPRSSKTNSSYSDYIRLQWLT